MSVAEPPVEPTPSRASDLGRLAVLLLLALSLRAWTVINTTVPSRDCIVFVRDGLQLETPPDGLSRLDVIKKAEHPPGYPAAIIAVSWLVRPLLGVAEPTVESMALSAQLVSLVAGVLLVIPLFLIARRLFDRNVAFAAVAIFMVLPVCVEVTSDGISDSLFLLTAAWAMWFAIRALEQQDVRCAFLFGIAAGASCGLGYLVRPDAAVLALGCGLTFAGVVCRRIRQREWRLPFAAGLGLVMGSFMVAGPYVATIGKLTNKKSGEGVGNTLTGGEPDPTYFRRPQGMLPGVNLPLAAWYDPVQDKDEWKPWWATKALWKEYSKAAHYSVPFFGLIGLLALGRRINDPRVSLLVVVMAIHLSVLWILAWKVDYVSQRHTLLSVMITCMLAAASLPVIGACLLRNTKHAWLQRRTAWQIGAALTIAIMATALPRDFRSLHYERAGHKAAGRWIAANGDRNIPVVDPFGWADWYAGRTLREYPNPNPKADRELYLIFEPNAKSPHSRLGTYEFSKEHSADPDIVYSYPEGVPRDKILVAVYHFKPAKK